MVLKKPAIVLSSSTFNNLACSHPSFGPSSSTLLSRPRSHDPRRKRRQCSRSYATPHDYEHPFHGDHYVWPESRHPQRPPTPYQIFSQHQDEPYSKRRFYELVKIYHPDRNKHLEEPGNEEYKLVLLERYRMIISANAILSDPEKKRAYDQFGTGWASWRDGGPAPPGSVERYRYTTWHRWRTSGGKEQSQWATDEDPMFNATWEDWERWYRNTHFAGTHSQRDTSWSSSFFSHGRPRGLYLNNYAFVSIVFVIAALSGIGQATRLGEASKTRQERINLVSEETSKHLMKARRDALDRASEGEDKRGQIKRLIREREGYGEGEFDGRALKEGDPGLCDSGLTKDRNEPKFWEKPPER